MALASLCVLAKFSKQPSLLQVQNPWFEIKYFIFEIAGIKSGMADLQKMDSSTSSSSSSLTVEEGVPSYISCIKVDGLPILPPLVNQIALNSRQQIRIKTYFLAIYQMNENKRAEMRYFRQVAIEKERTRQFLKDLNAEIIHPSNLFSHEVPSTPKYLTSTPRTYVKNEAKDCSTVEHLQGHQNFRLSEKCETGQDIRMESDSHSFVCSNTTFIISNYGKRVQNEENWDNENELDVTEKLLESSAIVLRRHFNTITTDFVPIKLERPTQYFDNYEGDDIGQTELDASKSILAKGTENFFLSDLSAKENHNCGKEIPNTNARNRSYTVLTPSAALLASGLGPVPMISPVSTSKRRSPSSTLINGNEPLDPPEINVIFLYSK